MLNFDEKIRNFEIQLNTIENNFADCFKTDILFFIGDLNISNQLLKFLDGLNSKEEIKNWIDKLTSRIVLHENGIELNFIIFDYIEFG